MREEPVKELLRLEQIISKATAELEKWLPRNGKQLKKIIFIMERSFLYI